MKYAGAREHHWPAVFGRIDQHVNGKPPFRAVALGFWKLLDIVGGVTQRSRRPAIRQGNGLIERTVPGHDATPHQNPEIQAGGCGNVPGNGTMQWG